MDDKEKEKQKRIKEVAKHLHPHDDEPDPTAYMGNYNFPQMLFAFCVGFCTMFVLAVDEINDFKGCPLPEYFQNESRSAPGQTRYANSLVPWRHGVSPCICSHPRNVGSAALWLAALGTIRQEA